MKYRSMGKTGDEVSILGFGCMRLPLLGDGSDRTRINDEDQLCPENPLVRAQTEGAWTGLPTGVGFGGG